MARLVVCAIIFVLLVMVKLLFPGALSGFAQSAGELIGGNADFKEAFAAIGRAISGEEGAGASLQDAYTAVFNPSQQKDGAQREDSAPAPEAQPEPEVQTGPQRTGASLPAEQEEQSSESGAAEREEQPSESGAAEQSQPAAPAVVESPVEPAEDADDTATAEPLSYVYTMPALPDNASLEQRNLGFAHSSPILGSLSSSFGWRVHPIEGGSRFHYGVDLAADEGTDILAFADGAVYATGESSTLGNYIMLQHQGGYITLYAHCSRVTVTGGSVAMGEKIAEVGCTGQATGPHLHFELHDGSLYLNPIFYVEIR